MTTRLFRVFIVWLYVLAEKRLAVERLRGNQTGIKNTTIKRYQIVQALLGPKTWFFFLFGLSTQVMNGAASNFGSLIIKDKNDDTVADI